MNLMLLWAQVAPALADSIAGANPVLTPVNAPDEMNLWSMAVKGGWIMVVLALMSLLCFYILFERNYVIRKASNLSKQSHILAANVDLALLVVTVERPETSLTFIDRFLASAEAYRVPAALAFNKMDDLDAAERQTAADEMALYAAIGYPCFALSALTGEGTGALTDLLRDKTTLLAGHSGVGKSTLLNLLVPDADARTAAISEAHQTGMHTTTFSALYDLPGGGALIDIPGIKGFGTFDMERGEVAHYFRDLFALSADCRFYNCTHTHEPGCAVLRALDEGRLAPSRYQSYLSMLEDKDEAKYRPAF